MLHTTRFRFLIVAGAVITSMLTCAGAIAGEARVVFLHGAPLLTKLDVRFDQTLRVFHNAKYTKKLPAEYVPAANYDVRLTTVKNVTDIVPPLNFTFVQGTTYLFTAMGSVSGDPPLQIGKYEFPTTPHNGKARVMFINLMPDGGPFNLLVDGSDISGALSFSNNSATTDVNEGSHQLEVQQGGSTYTGPLKAKLLAGASYAVVVMGTDNPADGLPVLLKWYRVE